MKNFILVAALMVVGMVGITHAQTEQTQNEGVIAYQGLVQDVSFDTPIVPTRVIRDGKFSNGVAASYTRYTEGEGDEVGVLGLTGEAAVNFTGDGIRMATFMGGATLKARNNKFIQPYVRALGGVATQDIKNFNVYDNTQTSFAFDAGTGIDWRLREGGRVSLRTSVDYLNTGFNGERGHNFRFGAGIVF